MKIITWNIYKRNPDVRKALKMLKEHEPDLICLQEFPVDQAGALEELDMEIHILDEFLEYKKEKKEADHLYTVFASKAPVSTFKEIKHKNVYEAVTKTDDRYKFFKADSGYIEVDTPEGSFRIFNVHFKCVAGPYHRLSQFREILDNLSKDRENIICGDFNSFGKQFLNLFVWKYFGYKLREIAIHERGILNALIDLYEFKNPFRGKITFLKFPVQLDYILIPYKRKIIKKKRLPLTGSDHFPLYLEF